MRKRKSKQIFVFLINIFFKKRKNLQLFLLLCLDYSSIDDVIQAVKSGVVNGMLLDRFTASYYQSRGKLKSLIALKKFEHQRDVGVLFSKDTEDLANCLVNLHRSDILKSAQIFTDTYKVTSVNLETRFSSACAPLSVILT